MILPITEENQNDNSVLVHSKQKCTNAINKVLTATRNILTMTMVYALLQYVEGLEALEGLFVSF